MNRFYMDEQVPVAITKGLRQRGIDVMTVEDDRAKGTPDPAVLDRATSLGRILFTMDHHFLIEAVRRLRLSGDFLGVIYIRPGTVEIGKCIDDLATAAEAMDPENPADKILHLPF